VSKRKPLRSMKTRLNGFISRCPQAITGEQAGHQPRARAARLGIPAAIIGHQREPPLFRHAQPGAAARRSRRRSRRCRSPVPLAMAQAGRRGARDIRRGCRSRPAASADACQAMAATHIRSAFRLQRDMAVRPTITWSCTTMPSSLPASAMRLVIWMSGGWVRASGG